MASPRPEVALDVLSGRSERLGEPSAALRQQGELTGTLLPLGLAFLDYSLHAALALWVSFEFPAERHPFALVAVVPLLINLVFVVGSIARSPAIDAPATHDQPPPSELHESFRVRPEQSVPTIVLSLVCPESMCFLTHNVLERAHFRRLTVLSLLAEDLPSLIIQIIFLHAHGWVSIVAASFGVTLVAFAFKGMRAWVLLLAATCDTPPRLPLGANLAWEDMLSLPLFALHWCVMLAFLVWVEWVYASERFGAEWLAAHLDVLGGVGAALVGVGNVSANASRVELLGSNQTYPTWGSSGSELAWEYDEAGSGEFVPSAPPSSSPAMPPTAPAFPPGSLPTTVELARSLLELCRASQDPSDCYPSFELTPLAGAQLAGWFQLRGRMRSCFIAGVFFFVLASLANLSFFLRCVGWEHRTGAFRSCLLWRHSAFAAVVGVAAIFNGGAINAISQDRIGYYEVKRVSASLALLTYGIPLLTVIGVVVSSLDCEHRPCNVYLHGSSAAAYSYLALVLTVPVVLLQLLGLLIQWATAPTDEEAIESLQGPPPDEVADAHEPPDLATRTCCGRFSFVTTLSCCVLKWTLQLVAVLTIYSNSELFSETGWLSGLGLGLAKHDPPVGINLGFTVSARRYRAVLGIFLSGMMLNVLTAVFQLGPYATWRLRRTVHNQQGLTLTSVALTMVHPEFLGLLIDRREDVQLMRRLGAVSALCADLPMIAALGVIHAEGYYRDGSWTPFIVGVVVFSSLHMGFFLARALVTAIAGHLRRPTPDGAMLHFVGVGDCISMLVSYTQIAMASATIPVCYEAWRGQTTGEVLDDRHAGMFLNCAVVMSIVLALHVLANGAMSISFLNHWSFSHEAVADSSFVAPVVFLASLIDGSALALLAVDEDGANRPKQAAAAIALPQLSISLIVVVVILVFANVDFEAMAVANGMPSRGLLQGAAFLTVTVLIWKILTFTLLFIRHRGLTADGMPSPYCHTPFVFGAQWMANRQPPEGGCPPYDAPYGRASHMMYGESTGTRDRYEMTQKSGRSSRYDPPTSTGPREGYQMTRVTRTSSRSSATVRRSRPGMDAVEVMHPGNGEPLMEADCVQRAVYQMPDGVMGVFVQLPVDESQPMPFLFLPVLEVRPCARRTSSRKKAQVTIVFAANEVGDLDRDFIEASIFGEPAAARRELEIFNAAAEPPLNVPFVASPYGVDHGPHPLRSMGPDTRASHIQLQPSRDASPALARSRRSTGRQLPPPAAVHRREPQIAGLSPRNSQRL